jgi:hypothetical protein
VQILASGIRDIDSISQTATAGYLPADYTFKNLKLFNRASRDHRERLDRINRIYRMFATP